MWTDMKNRHLSWDKFFTKKMIKNLNTLEKNLKGNYCPEGKNVLSFSDIDLSKIKVVVLGHDPYPNFDNNNNSYTATGRAFEVGNFYNNKNTIDDSWNNISINPSLQNIMKKIVIDLVPTITINNVFHCMKNGKTNLLKPSQIFDFWEKQGVFFLNVYLTVEKNGEAGSHEKEWENIEFSSKLIKYIDTQNPDIIWFLWGNNAEKHESYIKKGTKYYAYHPSYGLPFFENNYCFLNTSNLINWVPYQ